MNIKEAKEQIEQSVSTYLRKDEFGQYKIPIERQRPVFLLGPPGIGKTAIMEQIAQSLDIALVSYSMTHHTRQSALGLPFIRHKVYGDQEFDVSEYTMSEIVASVYEMMEQTGKKEGILFLDEINCVSETLAPSMLQFLQYKTFGKHRIPEGWIVATAGNPPQFNRSVREFDVVTMDRLRVLEVEADYDTWRNYAVNKGLHSAILTYLDVKKSDFYQIENTVDGKSYVTARGWEDLSETLYLYEEQEYAVGETLACQFLRNKKIAREFAAYYDLYCKYKQDYQVHQILDGEAGKSILERAKKAGFDERLSLMGLLMDALQESIRDSVKRESTLRYLTRMLREVKGDLIFAEDKTAEYIEHVLTAKADAIHEKMLKEDAANALGSLDRYTYMQAEDTLRRYMRQIKIEGTTEPKEAFAYLKNQFELSVGELKRHTDQIAQKLDHLFTFVEKVFGDGNEMLVLVTDLTINYASAKFIAEYGCKKYFKYNKKFQIHERQMEIANELEQLDLSRLSIDEE
ncbi:ATP-binding protein [Eubacterium oxidoreducens]|uniref:ATPase family associated with various cellular activities (AAA) n=1 Tax=Eubacterium oxidoreducens TaxID=1732 RepID=A0A1G6CGR2_EUBOX|nr:MoxR family ATPase [Eubacterium oxidoreducens]SDB32104.1 ATPase family associated with various cellular activities (AAA) [Eubacterium oxidoreducens]